MIKNLNTIDRNGLKLKMITLYDNRLKESLELLENLESGESYKEKFEYLKVNYEKAQLDKIEIE